MPSDNPRYAHYSKRVSARKRIAAMGEPCWLCGHPIDYSLGWWTDPKDGRRKRHPLSFEVDEVVPVSKGGSPTDMDNLRPAHRICNQRRGNKEVRKVERDGKVRYVVDGHIQKDPPKESPAPIAWSAEW